MGFGGGAENRTPVHNNPLKGISMLSRCSGLAPGRHTDKRAHCQPVQSFPAPYRLRAQEHSPKWRRVGSGDVSQVDVAA